MKILSRALLFFQSCRVCKVFEDSFYLLNNFIIKKCYDDINKPHFYVAIKPLLGSVNKGFLYGSIKWSWFIFNITLTVVAFVLWGCSLTSLSMLLMCLSNEMRSGKFIVQVLEVMCT